MNKKIQIQAKINSELPTDNYHEVEFKFKDIYI